MIRAARWVPSGLVAACFAGAIGLGASAQAEDASAPAAVSPGHGCDAGQMREGKGCMHQIAPAGTCATARPGTVASGGGGSGGDCGDAIGEASTRFTPAAVAFGPGSGSLAFNPPAPGPPPGPDLQPGEIGGGGPGGPPGGGGGGGGVGPPPPPPAPPVITVIESPAPIDPLPGLLK